jgi:hypothetical protein
MRAERSAIGCCRSLDFSTRDREADPRRLTGAANIFAALAGAHQGHGLRERLPDGAQRPARCRCRRRPSSSLATSVAVPATKYRREFSKLRSLPLAARRRHVQSQLGGLRQPRCVDIVIHNYRWRWAG